MRWWMTEAQRLISNVNSQSGGTATLRPVIPRRGSSPQSPWRLSLARTVPARLALTAQRACTALEACLHRDTRTRPDQSPVHRRALHTQWSHPFRWNHTTTRCTLPSLVLAAYLAAIARTNGTRVSRALVSCWAPHLGLKSNPKVHYCILLGLY